MTDTVLFAYVLLPLMIFFARIADVTLQTLRILAVSRGNKIIAPLLGFFEVIIWLMAIGEIMKNLSNPFCYLAYGAGFAMGNYVGIRIEEKTAIGKQIIRIITRKNAQELLMNLRRQGFGVTDIPAHGKTGEVSVLYTIIERYDLERVVKAIETFNPNAFYTIEDIRNVNSGIFPTKKPLMKRLMAGPYKRIRKKRIYKRMIRQRKGR